MTLLVGTWNMGRYSRRGFLRGAASALDMRGDTRRHYIIYQDPASADIEAMRGDFKVVGEDLSRSLAQYSGEHRD